MKSKFEAYRFYVNIGALPNLPDLPGTFESPPTITFERTTSSTAQGSSYKDSDFWTWVQAFMGQPSGFAFHYTQADEPARTNRIQRSASEGARASAATYGSNCAPPSRRGRGEEHGPV